MRPSRRAGASVLATLPTALPRLSVHGCLSVRRKEHQLGCAFPPDKVWQTEGGAFQPRG